ncbi:hypothetical protein IKF15_01385 [Candidatus Saccharibacteria bacterium]|nr:hypothetical protein [Candidatus Saccharibacteria bacterium]
MKRKKTLVLFLFFAASVIASGILYDFFAKQHQDADALSVSRNTSIQGAKALDFSPFSTIVILSPISVFAFVNLAILNHRSEKRKR